MEKAPKSYFADGKRIHHSNINLHKVIASSGMAGSCHSELISRLTAKLEHR
jgi:hypothetical protein